MSLQLKNRRLHRVLLGTVLSVLFIIIVGLSSCDVESADNNTDEDLEELFLGMKFGMSKQMWLDTTGVLNNEGVVGNEGRGLMVQYKIEKNLKNPVYFNYYPDFHNNKLSELPAQMHYESWAPWNKELWSDKLVVEAKALFENWFGPGFKKVDASNGKIKYVKSDGPRTITLTTHDDQHINVSFTHDDYLEK